LFFRHRDLELPERELLHRHAPTQFLRLQRLPDKPYRSSNLGSFRTKA